MKLHEFMKNNRAELLRLVVLQLKRDAPDRPEEELAADLGRFIDEVADAVRTRDERGDGAARQSSPSVYAARLGHERYQKGYPIGQTAKTLSALSVAVGELGGRESLAFAADEYRNFNETIDEAVATAIEQYAKDERDQHSVTSRQLGFVAHEFRNAASSGKMAFQMLERGQVAMQGRTAEIVRRSFRRMEKLAEKTFFFLRANEGAPPSLKPVPLAPLLRDIEGSSVLERNIDIVVDVDDAVSVLADEELLTSAISNLVQNAIKFSHDDAHVLVRARRNGASVLIEVEDECGGLPPGTVEELFEPFVRKGSDRRGAGLGLAITQQAVHRLLGEMSVRDVPGHGCVFAIRLDSAKTLE
jgi:signal transduction histidine kinase